MRFTWGVFAVVLVAIATHFIRPTYTVYSTGVVVITGASTGIGAAAATKLAGLGFTVLAGVRKIADGEALAASIANSPAAGRVVPILIDVTQVATLEAAAQAAAALGPVVGVFCNAGVDGGRAPVELNPASKHATVFAVNYFGVVDTARVFLPLLRASHGRLLVTGSVAGTIASPLLQPYSATKFAVRSLADTLRRELAELGVAVIRIDPGFVKTPIIGKSDGSFMAISASERAPYQPLFDRTAGPLRKMASLAYSTDSTDRAVVHAMTAARPQAVYHPGSLSGLPACIMTAFMNTLGTVDPHWQDFALNIVAWLG